MNSQVAEIVYLFNIVSDIAIFVLKRDVKLQLTHLFNCRSISDRLLSCRFPVVAGRDQRSFPSNRHHRSNRDCLEGKRENYQVCSVRYCVQQCTVQCTHMNRPNSSLEWVLSHWAHFTVLRFIFVYVCILCITIYCML